MTTITGSLDGYNTIYTHDPKPTASIEAAVFTAFSNIVTSVLAGQGAPLIFDGPSHSYNVGGEWDGALTTLYSSFSFTNKTTNESLQFFGDLIATSSDFVATTSGTITSITLTGPHGTLLLTGSLSFLQTTIFQINTTTNAWSGTIDEIQITDSNGENPILFSDLSMDINTYIAISEPAAFLAAVLPTITTEEPEDLSINTSGDDTYEGSDGVDGFSYDSLFAGHVINITSEGVTISSSIDGTDLLTNVERIHFSDTSIALDLNGNAGEAYRIYKAAFDREPDLGGLGFWIAALDNGADALEMAAGFTGSIEFKNLYGENNSNNDYIDLLYNNVLDRSGDAEGHAFWLGHLDAGTVTREQLLIDFSESGENQVNVIDLISSGIEFTLFS